MGETRLGDGDVKRPGGGVAVGLALLAMQAGPGPGYHILSKAITHESRRNQMSAGKHPWM
jgi:hypothetical protein